MVLFCCKNTEKTPTFAQTANKTFMYDIKDFEIMAPVGSRESLAAAIQAGADSIYFGIESLNMRARSASTFTINDLREIAQICDEHGIKSYLTINTIIYDEDVKLMRTIVDAAKEAGISAVIAADVAVMSYCNEVGQEVHLSTQLNISNAEALKIAVIIGPEGGLEEKEVEVLKSMGARSVSLGKRILRTETVAIVLSSVIMYELGEFGEI